MSKHLKLFQLHSWHFFLCFFFFLKAVQVTVESFQSVLQPCGCLLRAVLDCGSLQSMVECLSKGSNIPQLQNWTASLSSDSPCGSCIPISTQTVTAVCQLQQHLNRKRGTDISLYIRYIIYQHGARSLSGIFWCDIGLPPAVLRHRLAADGSAQRCRG